MRDPEDHESTDEIIERERRFLVPDISIVDGWAVDHITQAYFSYENGLAFRLRVSARMAEDGTITEKVDTAMKGPRASGERLEDQAPLRNVKLAKEIISISPWVIRKHRFWGAIDGEAWIVDVFQNENSGLAIAELEGDDIWNTPRPAWVAREITHSTEYNNEILARFPMHTRARDPAYAAWLRGMKPAIVDPGELDDPDF